MTTWYREGLITLTTGSDIVAGVGTEWVDSVLPGGIFFTPTGLVEVERVISDGSLKLVSAYSGPSVAGAEYAIAPTQGYVTALSKEVNALLGTFGELKDAWQDGTLVGKGVALKGVKNSVGDLPIAGNAAGDAWMVAGHMHVWSGTGWIDQGNTVATAELEALRDAAGTSAGLAMGSAMAADTTRKDYEDRVYPSIYSSPPSNKPHSGLPSQDGDRAVIIALGQPLEHIRTGGGWLIPNMDMAAFADPGGAALVGGVTPIYTVKDFRKAGGRDSQIINRALRKIEFDALDGSRLVLECGRRYTYDSSHSLGYINNLEIDFNGALLKRASSAATTSKLSNDVDATGVAGRTLPLASVSEFEVGDLVFAVNGTTNAQASNVRRITAINRITKTATLNFQLDGIAGVTTHPAGTVIAKSFNCFVGRPSAADSSTLLTPGANKRISIHGGTIDGNESQQVSYSWRVNSEIILHSEGGSIYRMTFQNTAAECIVGHGMTVSGCTFLDLGGSALHTSVNDFLVAISTPTVFTGGNIVRRTNLKGQAASGHAEGAITFSWGPGHLIISNNFFEGGNEALFGNFGVSTGANPSMLLVITGNICKGYPKLFAALQASTYGVTIVGNSFHDCGDNTELTTKLYNRLNRIGDNSVSGNTVLPEQPSLVAQRFGPTVIETVGGAGPAVATNPGNRLWLKQSGSGFPAASLADSNGVLESADHNYFSFVGVATKVAGILFKYFGSDNPIAGYLILVASEKAMKLGVNIPGGHTMLKSGNFVDHLKLEGTGETVFMRRDKAIYIGDQATDGSWHIDASGTDLIFRRRVGGSWVVKQTVPG